MVKVSNMSFSRFILSFTILAATIQANPLIQRQLTTTTATTTAAAASSSTTGALIETTIDGKITTIPVASLPSITATPSTGDSPSQTSNTAATNTVSEGAPGVPEDTALGCHNDKDQPICLPHPNQQLLVGNTYWSEFEEAFYCELYANQLQVQWSSTAFPANTSITVGLQYGNNASQVAWISDQYVTQRGYTEVTIQEDWLEGYVARNLSLIWNTFSATAGDRKVAFQVEIDQKPVEHYPAPAKSKVPDKESLVIALPVTLGFLCIVMFGLYFGMRKHRHIGLKSVMGRGRRGYGNGKSRRERLGIKKGAIRLEDREVFSDSDVYRDDDDIVPAPLAPQARKSTDFTDKSEPIVTSRRVEPQTKAPPQLETFPAPPQVSGHNFYSSFTVPPAIPKQTSHERDLSLGSLLADDDSNAFRREVLNQQKEKPRD